MEVYARPERAGESCPSMMVFAGGAMKFFTAGEMEPICRYYDAHGYQTFVVRYSVDPFCKYPDLLWECSRAVWEIRRNAAAYGVDPDRIAMNGFSAGAHVITMYATHYHLPIAREGTEVPEGGNAICATITGYTPTTFENFGRGNDLTPEQRAQMEADMRSRKMGGWALLDEPGSFFGDIPSLTSHAAVNAQTPPAFLWQSTSDVPGCAWDYAMNLKKCGVDFELHYFSDELKGASMDFDPELHDKLRVAELNTAMWPQMSLNWLERVYSRQSAK